jgi:hypothetical protein
MLTDYEVDLFNDKGQLSIVISLACATDTAALCDIIKMGVVDYQRITVWRESECLYVGKQLTGDPGPGQGSKAFRNTFS